MEAASTLKCSAHDNPAVSFCLTENCPLKLLCPLCQPNHNDCHKENMTLVYPISYLSSGRVVDDLIHHSSVDMKAHNKKLEEKIQGFDAQLSSFAKKVERMILEELRNEAREFRIADIYVKAKSYEQSMLEASPQAKQELFIAFSKEFNHLVKAVEDTNGKTSEHFFKEVDAIYELCDRTFEDLAKTIESFIQKKYLKMSSFLINRKKLANLHSLIPSTVMTNSTETEYVRNLIPKAKLNLLYRASRDGFSSGDFHSRCDGKGRTITLVHANGRAFGGYADQSWDCDHQYKESDSTFVFSITDKQRFRIKQKSMAVITWPGSGPIFGYGADLRLSSNCNENLISRSKLNICYSDVSDEGEQCSFLAGEKHFSVDDYEVYQIINVD